MGLTAAAFVVILAVTGLILNHTETLKLDSRMIKSDVLLDWYRIAPPENPVSFSTGNSWISQLGQRLYFNGQEIADTTGKLIGAATLNDIIVIAVNDQILLTTLTGQLIERLGSADGVPAGMRAITSDDNDRLLILAAHGTYITDSDFIEWQERATTSTNWSKPSEIPAELYRQLVTAYRGSGLPMERVILDIHSGRILGPWGVYVMDAAAILFILLAAAGIWLWAKRNH